MPIIDIEFVRSTSETLPASAALASALGRALGTPAGRTWVRVRRLDPACYAENDATVSGAEQPVFVTVLHAHPPTGEALAAEARLLTQAVAACCDCLVERVHLQYAPPAAGRQAFGGVLVQ